MIAFPNGYNPFREPEDSNEVAFEVKTDTDLELRMRSLLKSYGKCLELTKLPSYKRFMKRGLQIAPRFVKRDMPLTVILIDGSEPEESLIEVKAEFPSETGYPYIRYETCSMDYCYPQDFTCPYSFLTNLIRTERLMNEHDKNFAWNIANHLNRRGCLHGQEIIDPRDVEFAREVVRDICGNGKH